MFRFKSFQLVPCWGHEVVANYIEKWFQWLWFDITWYRPIDGDNIIKLRRKR